ncbi:peptidoglycan editing factor PgeF [Sulfurimonas sp.]
MKFYQSKLLNEYARLTHAFTCKESNNLAFHVGDKKDKVKQNHKHLAQELGYNFKTLVHMNQIHSNLVKIVDEADNFDNPPTCDALITNKKNTPLMVMVADCSPLLFFDPKQNVIAVAHAGRAGAFKNIVHNVIQSFSDDFHSHVTDILVSIGPCICQNCYEVNEIIYQEAKNLQLDSAVHKKEKKIYLDIKAILQKQLHVMGIPQKNIEISNICNCCHADTFYSYRKKNTTGRFGGVIML